MEYVRSHVPDNLPGNKTAVKKGVPLILQAHAFCVQFKIPEEKLLGELLNACINSNLLSNRQIGEIWNTVKGHPESYFWDQFYVHINAYHANFSLTEPGTPEDEAYTPAHVEAGFECCCGVGADGWAKDEPKEVILGRALKEALNNGPDDEFMGSVTSDSPGTPPPSDDDDSDAQVNEDNND